MLPFRQVGPSVTVVAGTPLAVTAQSSVVLVSAPAANAATAYFNYAPSGTIPGGQGVPVIAGTTLQIATPTNSAEVDWFATGANLLVTPIEILKT